MDKVKQLLRGFSLRELISQMFIQKHRLFSPISNPPAITIREFIMFLPPQILNIYIVYILYFMFIIKGKCKTPSGRRRSCLRTDFFFILYVNWYGFFGKILERFLVTFSPVLEFRMFLLLDWVPFKARESSLRCFLAVRRKEKFMHFPEVFVRKWL